MKIITVKFLPLLMFHFCIADVKEQEINRNQTKELLVGCHFRISEKVMIEKQRYRKIQTLSFCQLGKSDAQGKCMRRWT